MITLLLLLCAQTHSSHSYSPPPHMAETAPEEASASRVRCVPPSAVAPDGLCRHPHPVAGQQQGGQRQQRRGAAAAARGAAAAAARVQQQQQEEQEGLCSRSPPTSSLLWLLLLLLHVASTRAETLEARLNSMGCSSTSCPLSGSCKPPPPPPPIHHEIICVCCVCANPQRVCSMCAVCVSLCLLAGESGVHVPFVASLCVCVCVHMCWR